MTKHSHISQTHPIVDTNWPCHDCLPSPHDYGEDNLGFITCAECGATLAVNLATLQKELASLKTSLDTLTTSSALVIASGETLAKELVELKLRVDTLTRKDELP